jgi:UDP-glucose:(heptosyl)LPS alpha-1,3-glucosyltransferase
LRIAVVSPFVDRRHGTERAIAELIERLARDYACEIHLYAGRLEGLPEQGAVGPSEPNTGVIRWHKVPAVPGPHIVRFLGWLLLNSFLRRWHQRAAGVSYDLVLSPGINCLHPDVVIVHALFCRLQELAQDEEAAAFTHGGILRHLHRRLYYGLLSLLERRVYTNRQVTLAAVSRRTAALLATRFSRQDVAVVPNGVDTREFSPVKRLALRTAARRRWTLSESECVLLLVGNDWRVKGLPAILQALATLRELPLRLLVAGHDDLSCFQGRAAQLGVADRCLWQNTHTADVMELYGAADIYVSPSHEDSFGLPVAESMACGLPVITSICSGVADCVEHGVNGFVLQDPCDLQSLTAIIARLQASVDLRQTIGDAAAQSIRQFDWESNAAAVWRLLKETESRNDVRHQ